MPARRRPTASRGGLTALVAALVAGCGGASGGGKKGTAHGAFVQIGSLATGRVHHTATLLTDSGQVLVVGGKGKSGSTGVVLDSAELFDPATGTFTP